MKFPALIAVFSFCLLSYSQEESLVKIQEDGRFTLSEYGASYFAKLSLECTEKPSPHFIDRVYKNRYKWKYVDTVNGKDYWPSLRQFDDKPTSEELWPSFYGCYDWHSSVHNHWCLVKLLKKFPDIPEASLIRQKLNSSFDEDRILLELDFIQKNEYGLFEFPYGQSWLLKVADELAGWDDPDAKRWLNNISPLAQYISAAHTWYWRNITPDKLVSGSHDSPSMGLAFAYDYAVTFGNDELKKVVDSAAMKYYYKHGYKDLSEEPIGYDFMSGGLLVTDIMRKILSPKKLKKWIKKYAPELLDVATVEQVMQIKKTEKHDEYEAHWDGYHLNRIWCLNGLLVSMKEKPLSPALQAQWAKHMNAMWDYAQESIGKGNYDIDHWLSSFSVFALIGYE